MNTIEKIAAKYEELRRLKVPSKLYAYSRESGLQLIFELDMLQGCFSYVAGTGTIDHERYDPMVKFLNDVDDFYSGDEECDAFVNRYIELINLIMSIKDEILV